MKRRYFVSYVHSKGFGATQLIIRGRISLWAVKLLLEEQYPNTKDIVPLALVKLKRSENFGGPNMDSTHKKETCLCGQHQRVSSKKNHLWCQYYEQPTSVLIKLSAAVNKRSKSWRSTKSNTGKTEKPVKEVKKLPTRSSKSTPRQRGSVKKTSRKNS